MIRAADQVIEIGPGAGERGGKVVFQGTPSDIEDCPKSVTGDFLAGRRGIERAWQAPPQPITAGFAWPARAATI